MIKSFEEINNNMKFDKLAESIMENTDNASNITQKPDPRWVTDINDAFNAIKNGLWTVDDFAVYLQEVADEDRYNSV